MKYFAAALMLSACASGALAAEATCKSQALEKKLAGAALESFMKKCETDAATACDVDSKAKKLSGAALDSHMKKCIADKVGATETKPAAPAAAAKPTEATKPTTDKK